MNTRVIVKISKAFRKYLGNQDRVSAEGSDVGECLEDLSRQYPNTIGMFLDQEGNLLSHFDILLNGKRIYPIGKSAPVQDGDVIQLVYIIHGG